MYIYIYRLSLAALCLGMLKSYVHIIYNILKKLIHYFCLKLKVLFSIDKIIWLSSNMYCFLLCTSNADENLVRELCFAFFCVAPTYQASFDIQSYVDGLKWFFCNVYSWTMETVLKGRSGSTIYIILSIFSTIGLAEVDASLT